MMRRALLLGVLVLAGGVPLAVAGADDGLRPAIRHPVTFRLLDVSGSFTFVDVPPRTTREGDVSAGDLYVFENTLRNRADTQTVGRFDSICTALAAPGRVLCRG